MNPWDISTAFLLLATTVLLGLTWLVIRRIQADLPWGGAKEPQKHGVHGRAPTGEPPSKLPPPPPSRHPPAATEEVGAKPCTIYLAQMTIDGTTYDFPYAGGEIFNTTIPVDTPIYFRLPAKERAKDHCTCHPRDSSFVCDYCYKQGHRGHMQCGEEP